MAEVKHYSDKYVEMLHKELELKIELLNASNSQVYQDIMTERARQDHKWGEQNHMAPKWSLIMLEELGEVAKEILEHNHDKYMKELIQATAVMVAWLECEYRRQKNETSE